MKFLYKKRFKRGIFALSGDPVTLGHIDVIRQALRFCESVVVLIANNTQKTSRYLFTIDERAAMMQKAIDFYLSNDTKRIDVIHTSGLFIDAFLEQGCDVVIRGIRNEHDKLREDEQQALYSTTEPLLRKRFLYIQSNTDYSAISSTWVKELVSIGIDVSPFVPLFVKGLLEQRLLHQTLIGITGPFASGKTTLATSLVSKLTAHGISAQHISLDTLIRELYDEQSPGADGVRAAIIKKFGAECLTQHNTVNRPILQKKLFQGSNKQIHKNLQWIEHLTAPHVFRLLRQKRSNTSIVIIEWATTESLNLSSLVNNHIVVINTPDQQRAQHAEERTIEPSTFKALSRIQLSAQEIQNQTQIKIAQDGTGSILMLQNNINVSYTFEDIAEHIIQVHVKNNPPPLFKRSRQVGS